MTDVVRESRQFDLENLATKADLKAEITALRTELKADTAALRTELKADIADLRAEMRAEIAAVRAEAQVNVAKLYAAIADSRTETLRWMIGLAIAQGGLIVTLIKLLH